RGIEGYRGKDWAEQCIVTPFAFAILSATPPPDIPPESVFPGANRDAALAHPVLRARLHAAKPAELVSLKPPRKADLDPLVDEAAARAAQWIRKNGRQRVAIIVNRV